MSLSLLFLGTSGSVPTPQRGLPAILLQRKGEYLMFDCGEGVQRQMIIAKTSFHKKMKVFVSHMHGDHVLGLPGLMQTMSLLERTRELKVYGPPGIEPFLNAVKETVQFNLSFPVEIHEIESNCTVCEEKDYSVEAAWSNHVIPNLSYALIEKPRPGRFHPQKARALGVPKGPLWSRLQHGRDVELAHGKTVKAEQVVGPSRPGRKIVYSGDTRPSKIVERLAAHADLLIHESTFDDELAEKAEEDGHSTPSQAAETAKNAGVKKLYLTHISARYVDPRILLEQAVKTFSNTEVAQDFMKTEIPLLDA